VVLGARTICQALAQDFLLARCALWYVNASLANDVSVQHKESASTSIAVALLAGVMFLVPMSVSVSVVLSLVDC
jgi:hypothetical protein